VSDELRAVAKFSVRRERAGKDRLAVSLIDNPQFGLVDVPSVAEAGVTFDGTLVLRARFRIRNEQSRYERCTAGAEGGDFGERLGGCSEECPDA
jgi:hypothetical protein